MEDASPLLFCFGYGYTAAALASRLHAKGWRIAGTRREAHGPWLRFDRAHPQFPIDLLKSASAILSSIPPDEAGDPVLDCYGKVIGESAAWRGYLSTTGVYGDAKGAWIDETAPLLAHTARGRMRIAAEQIWRDHGAHIFRLSGIYGPGRSQIEAVRNGQARRLVKPGQVFSRIHVDDIAAILSASIERPHPKRIYNVADDEPAPPQDVVSEAARLLNLPPPPEIPFEHAAATLSPMALSFYADNKRVSNERIKTELGVTLCYPTYREGLKACLEASQATA